MFKYKRLKTLIAAAFLTTFGVLAACTPIDGGGGVASVGSTVLTGSVDSATHTLYDEKAYYGLLKGEATLNRLAGDAVDIGIIKAGSPTAIRVADLLLKYAEISIAAQQAKVLNDVVGVTAKINAGKALYAQIAGLVGGK
jgi:hypothetical protein